MSEPAIRTIVGVAAETPQLPTSIEPIIVRIVHSVCLAFRYHIHALTLLVGNDIHKRAVTLGPLAFELDTIDVSKRRSGRRACRQPVVPPAIYRSRRVASEGAKTLHHLPSLTPRILEAGDVDRMTSASSGVSHLALPIVDAKRETCAVLDALLSCKSVRRRATCILRSVKTDTPNERSVSSLAALRVTIAIHAHHVPQQPVAKIHVGKSVVLRACLCHVPKSINGLAVIRHVAWQ